jgi:hypothetical protein
MMMLHIETKNIDEVLTKLSDLGYKNILTSDNDIFLILSKSDSIKLTIEELLINGINVDKI